MRRIYILALLVLALALGFAAGKMDILPSLLPDRDPDVENGLDPNNNGKQPDPDPEPDIRTVTLAAAGDMFPHTIQVTQARERGRQRGVDYDYTPCFEFIAPYFQAADFTTLNLETNQAGPEISYRGVSGHTGGSLFNSPIQLSEALKEAGVDLYATATNHALDRGLAGLKATLENVRALGFITTGTYLNPEERDTPVIVELDGIKIAFISYTDRTEEPLPAGHEYALNYSQGFNNISPIIADIQNARAAGADLVAVYPHWGPMYVHEPLQRLRDLSREFAAAGADLIVAGHAHVIQPMEWVYTEEADGSERPTLVVYSLGNFFTNQHYNPSTYGLYNKYLQYGLLLNVEITKNIDENNAWISGVDYEVHWCHRHWDHRILVLSEVFEKGPGHFNLSAAQFAELQEGYQRSIEFVELYGFSENMPWNRTADQQ